MLVKRIYMSAFTLLCLLKNNLPVSKVQILMAQKDIMT